jgi:acetyl-CoA C-acetyltransferase
VESTADVDPLLGVDATSIHNAERLAQRCVITREAADKFAATSHHKAARAWSAGSFGSEIVPVGIGHVDAKPRIVSRDEGIQVDASPDLFAAMNPLVPAGVVTAGNMSARNDGAAACLVVAEDMLEELGLEPMAYLVGWAAAGNDSSTAGLGTASAVAKLLAKAGLTLDDLDLVEVNERFAVEVLALLEEWEWDHGGRLNVNGSALSLGHPVGAAGIRIMTTMLHQLQRNGGRYGLETISMGPDHGIAALFEAAGEDNTSTVSGTRPIGARFHGAGLKRRAKHRP